MSARTATHPGALVERTRAEPDRIGVRFRSGASWIEWDRHRVAEELERAVRAVQAIGLRRGDRVAIFAATSVDWYLTALAIQVAGGAIVGVYPTSSPDQVRYILAHASCRLAFVGDPVLLGAVESVRPDLPDLERVVVFSDPDGDPAPWWATVVDTARAADTPLDRLEQLVAELDPDELCSIIYTSGTTGAPKGAMHSFRTIGQISRSVAPALGYQGTDDYLVYLPMSHTAEQQNTLVLGAAIGWTLNFSALEAVFADLPEVRPQVMFAVPRVLEKLHARIEAAEGNTDGLPLVETGLDRLRILLAGGAPLDAALLAAFARHGIQIRNGYGMTEGSGIAMPWSTPPRVDTVGTPLPGVELRLADDGEILVRSSGVCLGYFRDDDATAQMRTADGFLHTGDVGALTADGELQIVGRKKEIVITRGGKNIAPAGLEAQLAAGPGIRRAVVVGNDRPYLVALIEPESLDAAGPPDAAIDAHVAAVNETVSRPEQIKRFAVVDRPFDEIADALTPTQKLRRHVIEAAFAAEIDALYDAPPP